MCVLATQGLADLARVDPSLPQQITQNTAVRLALRQGSAEDQEGWSILLGGATVPFSDSRFVDRPRARAVSPDELATLRTGEAFLQVMPTDRDAVRKRLWITRPRRVGTTSMPFNIPETELDLRSASPWGSGTHTEWRVGDAPTIESTPPSELATDGTRPGDRGRGIAVATTHDEPDRALVLHESADGEQPNRGAVTPGLPEDDRYSLACVCACHVDNEGSSSPTRPRSPASRQRTGSTAARPHGGTGGSLGCSIRIRRRAGSPNGSC